MGIQFFSESTEADIPNAPGLYAFYLDMLGPAKIGLGGQGPFSKEVLQAARERLSIKIRRQFVLANEIILCGEISEMKSGGHLRRSYKLEATYSLSDVAAEEALQIDLDELREYSAVLASCKSLEKPVYIGITSHQTFRQRYLQHKSDFYATPPQETTFGGRFSVAGGEWDDLVFACVAVSSDLFTGQSLLRLERLMQSLTHPKYCLR